MSCSVGCRCSSDLVLLWLWLWPAPAGPIHLLAWELPYAMGMAKKDQKKKSFGFFDFPFYSLCTLFSFILFLLVILDLVYSFFFFVVSKGANLGYDLR